MFRAVARDLSRSTEHATETDAIAAGLEWGTPFDVHLPSGAVCWIWEQRDDEPYGGPDDSGRGDYPCDDGT